MAQDVPDYLRPGLKLVIVGINPGVRSGAAGVTTPFAATTSGPCSTNPASSPCP